MEMEKEMEEEMEEEVIKEIIIRIYDYPYEDNYYFESGLMIEGSSEMIKFLCEPHPERYDYKEINVSDIEIPDTYEDNEDYLFVLEYSNLTIQDRKECFSILLEVCDSLQ